MFFTVNTNYVIAQGKEYLGSRDIDLGFHVTDDNLKTSELSLPRMKEFLKVGRDFLHKTQERFKMISENSKN